MSRLAEHGKIRKTVLVTYFGKQYTTAKGLTSSLAEDTAHQILQQNHRNTKKYGTPTYNNPAKLALWRSQKSRLRKTFYRRALPIIEKMFQNGAK